MIAGGSGSRKRIGKSTVYYQSFIASLNMPFNKIKAKAAQIRSRNHTVDTPPQTVLNDKSEEERTFTPTSTPRVSKKPTYVKQFKIIKHTLTQKAFSLTHNSKGKSILSNPFKKQVVLYRKPHQSKITLLKEKAKMYPSKMIPLL